MTEEKTSPELDKKAVFTLDIDQLKENNNLEPGAPESKDVPSEASVTMDSEDGQTENVDNGEQDGVRARKRHVTIDRPVYDAVSFDEGFKPLEKPSKSAAEYFKSCCSCNPRSCTKKTFLSYLIKYIPFIRILLKYRVKDYFLGDLFAGCTVGIMHIPQGMAYAMLASLSPVYGLYTSFFPVLFYAFVGSSRHVSVGTFAIASLMVGSAVDKQISDMQLNSSTIIDLLPKNSTGRPGAADGYHGSGTGEGIVVVPTADPENEEDALFLEHLIMDEKVKIAASMALLSGIVVLVMGILRLGWLGVYLSEPLVSGFTTGAACHVFTSQIKHVFGLSIPRITGAFKLPKIYYSVFGKIAQTNWAALVTSLICMLMIILVKECINTRYKKKLRMPIPIELVVVILGTVSSHFLNLHNRFHIKVVGDIPTGVPAPRLPETRYMPPVLGDAIAAGIITYAISISMAKLLAKKQRYDVDSNQEMIAHGLSNIFSSFFSCYVSAASMSRSLIQAEMGGHTQITSLVSCCVVLIVLLVVGPLFYSLPNCVLASIIMVALKGMFLQFLDLKRLWRISKHDFCIWIVAFLGTVLLDVDLGLCVALAFSALSVIVRSQTPRCCILGRIDGTDLYVNKDKYEQAGEVSGIKIFRYESSVYFANAEDFKTRLYTKTKANPARLNLKRAKVTSKRKKAAKAREKEEKKQEREMKKLAVPDTKASNDIPSIIITPDMSVSTMHLDTSNGNGTVPNGSTPDSGEHIDWPYLSIHHVIIDCSMMAYIDSVGAKCIKSVVSEYREADVSVYLCNVRDDVRMVLEGSDFFAKGGLAPQSVYVSVHDAVLAAESHPNVQASRLTLDPKSAAGDSNAASVVSFDNLSVSALDDEEAGSNAELEVLVETDGKSDLLETTAL